MLNERKNLRAPGKSRPVVQRLRSFVSRSAPWAVIVMIGACLLVISLPRVWASEWQIVPEKSGDLLKVTSSKAGKHTLEIDDASGFRTPVVTKVFRGSKLQFHALDWGLIPGVDYHIRLDGDSSVRDLRLQFSSFTEPQVSCENLRRTWEDPGRRIVGDSLSRVSWKAADHTWVVLPHDPLIGQSLYPVEYYLRAALNCARACNDVQTMDEIALYYVAMLQFTEPLGKLLSRARVMFETKDRMAVADPAARTFPAVIGSEAADCELCNVQWLYPAAQLLRLISLLPPTRRTPGMQAFAGQYTKFIVVDQLDRYLVQQRMLAPGGGQAAGRIEVWKRALAGLKGENPWDTAMADIDLWLVASAANVLGANANDPVLTPLDARETQMLRGAVETGTRFFQSRRTEYPATRNFQGEPVGSAIYGNGDYATHRDFDYSGITGEKFPAPDQKLRVPNAGWDSMHGYRFPVFMRVLYENRKATGLEWPQYHDLQLLSNQYVYRVFNGDYSRPLFRNYLDGGDGWHRLGYHGGEFGYPPSAYCDQHNPQRPCMTPGQIMGWGLLGFANPDLARLEDALVKLAMDGRPEAQRFRDRYYFYGGSPYEMVAGKGGQTYGLALYFLIGDNAEMIGERLAATSR